MTDVKNALETVNTFIAIAKELAGLPALVLPQYQSSARDLYEISNKLLEANENLSRWMHKFLYFDFRNSEARGDFLTTVQEYKTMKSGPKFQKLKFSCGDIGSVYYRDIASKIGSWFSDQQKLEEAQGVFERLTDADRDMVGFTYDFVVGKLDEFVSKVEDHINIGALDDAEEARLIFKIEMREVIERLERFSGELADLVVLFAGAARVPITLGNTG